MKCEGKYAQIPPSVKMMHMSDTDWIIASGFLPRHQTLIREGPVDWRPFNLICKCKVGFVRYFIVPLSTKSIIYSNRNNLRLLNSCAKRWILDAYHHMLKSAFGLLCTTMRTWEDISYRPVLNVYSAIPKYNLPSTIRAAKRIRPYCIIDCPNGPDL